MRALLFKNKSVHEDGSEQRRVYTETAALGKEEQRSISVNSLLPLGFSKQAPQSSDDHQSSSVHSDMDAIGRSCTVPKQRTLSWSFGSKAKSGTNHSDETGNTNPTTTSTVTLEPLVIPEIRPLAGSSTVEIPFSSMVQGEKPQVSCQTSSRSFTVEDEKEEEGEEEEDEEDKSCDENGGSRVRTEVEEDEDDESCDENEGSRVRTESSISIDSALLEDEDTANRELCQGTIQWCKAPGETLMVRSSQYCTNHEKMPSLGELYDCIGVDFIETPHRIPHISNWFDLSNFDTNEKIQQRWHAPQLFVVTLSIPLDLRAKGGSEMGRTHTLVMYFGLREETRQLLEHLYPEMMHSFR